MAEDQGGASHCSACGEEGPWVGNMDQADALATRPKCPCESYEKLTGTSRLPSTAQANSKDGQLT